MTHFIVQRHKEQRFISQDTFIFVQNFFWERQ